MLVKFLHLTIKLCITRKGKGVSVITIIVKLECAQQSHAIIIIASRHALRP